MSREIPFPQWVPPEVAAEAESIDESEALAVLGSWVGTARPSVQRSRP